MAFREIDNSNEQRNFVKLSRRPSTAGLWVHTGDKTTARQINGFSALGLTDITVQTDGLKKPSVNIKFSDNTYFGMPINPEAAGWLGSVAVGEWDDIEAHIQPRPDNALALFIAIGLYMPNAELRLTAKVGNTYTTPKGDSVDINTWCEWVDEEGKIIIKIPTIWEPVEGKDKKRLKSLADILRMLGLVDVKPPVIDLTGREEAGGDLPF